MLSTTRPGDQPLDHSGKGNHLLDRLPEAVFVEQWRTVNKQSGEALFRILGRRPTQDEADAAASVIQWLGTEDGQRFIRLAEADIDRRQHVNR